MEGVLDLPPVKQDPQHPMEGQWKLGEGPYSLFAAHADQDLHSHSQEYFSLILGEFFPFLFLFAYKENVFFHSTITTLICTSIINNVMIIVIW